MAGLVACVSPAAPGVDAGDDPADVDAGIEPEPLPPLGGGASTLAGASQPGLYDGERGYARFANPVNVVATADGAVLVCDFDNGRIRHVDADGTTTSVGALPAGFARPFGAVRHDDTVWIQTDRSTDDEPTGALWRLDLGTGQVTLIRDDVGRYRGLGRLSDGRLVAAEYQKHVLSILDPATGAATALAGSYGVAGYVDATGAAARFEVPYDLVVLPGDVIVVADYANHVLRAVTLAGAVTTLAGDGEEGTDDGAAAAASFVGPMSLAPDGAGGVFVGDPDAGVIRHVSAAGQVTTFAGTGVPGYADADEALDAQFFGLEGLDLSSDGAYLFAADGTRGEDLPYHRVRRIEIAAGE